MTLDQFLMKLLKQWKIVLGCILILGIGAFIGAKLMKPVYESTALVQIAIGSGSNPVDYNTLMAGEQLSQTEADLAVSASVLREVASHYPGMSLTQLSKEVSASPNANTQLFAINVQDSDPTRAASLANDVANTLIKQQTQLSLQGSAQAQQQLQQEFQQTQQQITSVTNQIASAQADGTKQAQVAALQAQLSNLQTHATQLQDALVQIEVSQAQNGNFLVVVQSAQPALTPIQPNIKLDTGIGLLAGLLLGIALVLLFEQLDTRVSSPDVLAQALGCQVLATIVQTEGKEEVVNPVGNHPNVEAYRMLRTNIGFAAVNRPLGSILVTSAAPGEGKSVVAANLAIFMARAGKNTLLVDADLRHPSLSQLFQLPAQTTGFSNAIMAFTMSASTATLGHRSQFTPSSVVTPSTSLAGQVSLTPFIHAVNIPNLYIMPSGPLPPNPPELLDSKAMQQLMVALENSGADVIIFDAPPLLGLSDTSILVSKVDGTLVVVDINHTNRRKLAQLRSMLARAGAYVIGAAINKQPRGRDNTIYPLYTPGQEVLEVSKHSDRNGIPVTPTPDAWKQPENQTQTYGR